MTDGVFNNPGANPVGWRQQKLRDNGDGTASPFTYPRYLDGKTVTVGDTITTASNKWYGAVDLSAEGGTVGVFLNFIRLTVDKASSARGTIIGYVVTAITGTNANLTPVGAASFTQNDTPSLEIDILFSPSIVRTDVVAGATPFLKVQNSLKIVSTVINTATPLVNGIPFTPAVGDIVVNAITTTAGDMTFYISSGYGVY